MLLVNKDNLLIHTLIQSDQYNVRNEYDKAIRLLTDYLALQKDYEHDVAICAYTLSESYRLKGDKEKEKEYLIVSAMADMKTAVREYISLRKLAVLLYQEGDIERAYSYVKICMEDAAACNARLRKLEILEIFPIINDAYQQKTEKQQEQMKWALVSISLLSLFLLLAIFYVYKQMKKVAAARREVIDANKRLKELNDELHLSNAQLKDLDIYLTSEGYATVKAYDGLECLRLAEREPVDLILLDVMMPGLDGIRTTAKLRESCNVPIILLTAKSEDSDKILGLNIGADDYITKPFNPIEVIARVKSQLRRYTSLGGKQGGGEANPALLTNGGIALDDGAKSVTVDGEGVSLTPIEYNILLLLMKNPGRVFSTSQIYELVWNDPSLGSENTVAVHIRHLREKLEIDPANPRYIKVVWGLGYKMEKV